MITSLSHSQFLLICHVKKTILILLLWCYDIQQNTAFCNVLTRYSSSILLSHFVYCFAVFLFLSIIVQKSNFEMKIKVALHKRLFFQTLRVKVLFFSPLSFVSTTSCVCPTLEFPTNYEEKPTLRHYANLPFRQQLRRPNFLEINLKVY
jgi:hypothetical protein